MLQTVSDLVRREIVFGNNKQLLLSSYSVPQMSDSSLERLIKHVIYISPLLQLSIPIRAKPPLKCLTRAWTQIFKMAAIKHAKTFGFPPNPFAMFEGVIKCLFVKIYSKIENHKI